ncbi:MAG TPA: hypothetical protein VJG32_16620 [Anaerolineae bacterium]|nr:hypothetical protein [Anaerolineae bacterium]
MFKRGRDVFLAVGVILGLVGLTAVNALELGLVLLASVAGLALVVTLAGRLMSRRKRFFLIPILALYLALLFFSESVRDSLVGDPSALLVVAALCFILYGISVSQKA